MAADSQSSSTGPPRTFLLHTHDGAFSFELKASAALRCGRILQALEAVEGGAAPTISITVPGDVDALALEKVVSYLWLHGSVAEDAPPMEAAYINSMLQKFDDKVFLDEPSNILLQMQTCAAFLEVEGMSQMITERINLLSARPPSPPGPTRYVLESVGRTVHPIPRRAAALSPKLMRDVANDGSAPYRTFWIYAPIGIAEKVASYLLHHSRSTEPLLTDAQLCDWDQIHFLADHQKHDLYCMLAAAKYLELKAMHELVLAKLSSIGIVDIPPAILDVWTGFHQLVT